MRNCSFIAFITGILLTCGSCAEEELEIKGKVLDEHTKAAIPNREIIIQALVKNDNKFIPVYNGEFSTDSSGNFAYSLRKVRDVYLYNICIIGDSVYTYSNIELGLTELKRYGEFLCFSLNKLTDLTIKIDMKGRTPNNDVLYVSWESDGIKGTLLYPYTIKNYGFTSSNTGLKWNGGDIKSEIKTRVFADKETIVKWEIYSYGKRKEVTDTIICMRDVANYFSLKY